MYSRLSTAWQLIISGVVIPIDVALAQRVSAALLFGFEPGSDGFNAMLLTWLLLGGFLIATGLLVHAINAHRQRPKN